MKKSKKLRVVVDTNVLVSAFIIPHGNPYKLLLLWLEGQFFLLTSSPLREELADVLGRAKFTKYGLTPKEQQQRLKLIEEKSIDVSDFPSLPVIVRDTKDEKVLATALGGKADYFVTGDEDLLILNDNPKLGRLKLITVKEFLIVLQKR